MDANDPRHGRYAGAQAHYKAGVPLCEPCRIAMRRYDKQRVAGLHQRVAADEVRAHLERLIAAGMTPQLIIRAAGGVGRGTVRKVLRGERDFVTARVARALLAVPVPKPGVVGPTGYVPRLTAQRRVQALAAIGHTWREVSAATGGRVTPQGLGGIARGSYHGNHRPNLWMCAGTWHAIDEAYQQLHMTPGVGAHAKLTRERARREGWLPPLAWDDIDDPHEAPDRKWLRRTRERASGRRPGDDVDEAAVERFLGGDRSVPLSAAERFEVVRRWVASGRSIKALCDDTGWNDRRYIEQLGA